MLPKTQKLPLSLLAGALLACVVAILSKDSNETRTPSVADAAKKDQGHVCGPACQHSPLDQQTKREALSPRELDAALRKAGAFANWAQQEIVSEPSLSHQARLEGVRLAKERRSAMAALIESDPDEALRQALSYAEYAALPAELQALVERPFSMAGQLEVQVGCGDHYTQYHHYLETHDGGRLELSMPQEHRSLVTKSGLPVQGIELNGQAVVRAETFQRVEGADISFVHAEWPAGQVDPSIDFVTGEPIQGEGITAVAGGMVFNFQDQASLDHINQVMAEADAKPGMDGGSSWFMVAASGGDLEQFPEEELLAATIEANYSTTTGAKTTIVIMVDFSDATGQPFTPSSIESVIDTTVSDGLSRYSYGQTSQNATINTTTFRMPETASYYVGSTSTSTDDKHGELHTDAVAAYTGAGNPDPYSIYDTVCVVMTEIGFSWAGLASVGGQRMWLDSINSGVVLHEYGHNYGLRHAEYWVFDNSNGSSTNPVDPTGASQSYGDPHDNMGGGNVTDGHFNIGPKAFLGWVPGSDWEDLTGSGDNGVYRINRFDDIGATGTRGLRIAKSASSDHYWVAFRKDYANLESFANGANLTWEKGNGTPGRNQTWLLDMTPGSAGGKSDAALTLGRTYSDTASNVHITTLATGGTAPNEWLDVEVNFGSFPGNSAPTGSIIGSTSVNARETVLFNVEASDPNGDDLAFAWDMGDGKVKANSSVIAHSWIQGGSYDISVTVSDKKGGALTIPLTVTVTDPLNSWTSRTSGTTNPLYSIASNSTHVVVVGQRRILRSSDGTNWTNVTPGSGFTNVYLYDVCWTGTEFVACGMDWTGSGWEGEIWTSSNGSSWSRVYETNVNGTEFRGIACDDSGVIVAVGDSATISRRSSGGSWSSVSIGVDPSDVLRDVTWGDDVFTLVGHSTSPSYNGNVEVWTSGNGSSWTNYSSGAGLDSWKDFRTIHHTGTRLVASGWYSRACYSNDNAQNWSTNQTGNTHNLEDFASGAGLVYGVGVDKSNGDADVDLVSNDGQTWTVISPGALDNRNGIGFFANTFITVGQNGSIRQSGVISPTQTFADFIASHFPGGGNDAEPESNPDGDWADNLTEYALGTNPDSASSVPTPPVFSFDGSGDPALDVSRLSRQPGVAYSVWWSTDMQTWTRQGLTIETDNATMLRVVADGVDTSGGKGFLRARFDQ